MELGEPGVGTADDAHRPERIDDARTEVERASDVEQVTRRSPRIEHRSGAESLVASVVLAGLGRIAR